MSLSCGFRDWFFGNCNEILDFAILGLMYSNQCCGSGSGIRCLFTPRIRDDFFPDPGSRIPDPGSLPHPKFNILYIQNFTFKNGEKQEKSNYV
jgi:hypothetical protein